MKKGKYKRSKQLGVNRRGSVRFAKMMTATDSNSEVTTAVQPVYNSRRIKSVGKLEDSKESGKLRPVKLKSRVKMQVVQKAMLKQFYGRHLNQTALHNEVHSSYRNYPALSVVSTREQMVSVVRQRSGRAETREMSEAIIRDGHVQLMSNGKLQPVKYRSIKLEVGESLVVEETYYKKIRPNLSYFKEETKNVDIPTYLYVDLKLASVTLLRRPRDGEVLFPKNMRVSLSNLKKY